MMTIIIMTMMVHVERSLILAAKSELTGRPSIFYQKCTLYLLSAASDPSELVRWPKLIAVRSLGACRPRLDFSECFNDNNNDYNSSEPTILMLPFRCPAHFKSLEAIFELVRSDFACINI